MSSKLTLKSWVETEQEQGKASAEEICILPDYTITIIWINNNPPPLRSSRTRIATKWNGK